MFLSNQALNNVCIEVLSFLTRFPSSPLEIRMPFFLLLGFNKGTQKEKGQEGTTR